MIRKKNLLSLRLISMFVLLLVCGFAAAEQLISTDWGYGLDLPEGYTLENKDGSSRYHFSHQLFPITLQIALYPKGDFKQASAALTFVTNQLASEGRQVSFPWRLRGAAITQLKFPGGAGWAASVELAHDKGWLVLACHTKPELATELEPIIISTLDTIATDRLSWREPGPMTAFAWADEKEIESTFPGADRTIRVPFNSVDSQANQSVVDREFSLLTSYLNTPFVYTAWERYYRIIYRDAFTRFEKAAFLMESFLPEASEEKAATLLAWTQSFEYVRDREGADFLNLPETYMNRSGDCDSRALLLVVLLKHMGVDAVLLISPEYSHALAAIDCAGKGARFSVDGKDYLIADTTAKVGIGLIASDMADPDKWFIVRFPEPELP